MSKHAKTEDQAALECAEVMRHRWRYDHTEGLWFNYDGYIWRRAQKAEGLLEVRGLCTAMASEIEARTGDPQTTMRTARYFRSVESLVQIDPRIATTSASWDADPRIMAAPFAHFTSGRQTPPDAARMTTRHTGATPPPDPEHDGPQCPRWRRFLAEATAGDRDLVHYLQSLAGYCATGLTREQTFWFIFGPGGSGKGLFLDTLRAALGTYALSVPAEFFELRNQDPHPEELARLMGVRLVTASETRPGKTWNETRIKQITGDSAIAARYMRQNTFEFHPQCKLIISGNHQPRLRIVDAAMQRRMRVIPFKSIPEKPDPNLADALRAELPGIVAWIAEGTMHYLSSGLPMPEVVRRHTADYMEGQDIIGAWIAECTATLAGAFTAAGSLYDSYGEFCREQGEHPVSSRTLTEQLELRGWRRSRNKASRGFDGVRIIPRELPLQARQYER
jgi:putative DNA primase/helicase